MATGESAVDSSGLGFNFDTSGSDDGRPDGSGITDAFGSIDPNAGRIGNGDRDANGTEFDASVHISRDKLNADGSFRRKRGKRASNGGGKTTARASRKTSVNVNAVETALVGIHQILSVITATPELALESDESKPLAEAVAEVAKHYDMPEVAEVTIAWIGLASVAGPMYMAKVMLVRERMRAEKARNVTETSNVTTFPGLAPGHDYGA